MPQIKRRHLIAYEFFRLNETNSELVSYNELFNQVYLRKLSKLRCQPQSLDLKQILKLVSFKLDLKDKLKELNISLKDYLEANDFQKLFKNFYSNYNVMPSNNECIKYNDFIDYCDPARFSTISTASFKDYINDDFKPMLATDGKPDVRIPYEIINM
ncbi:unnamed protein product [Candida verbasci]|uniref:Uncharacterized protein n=1 Tax=Candida verbasci TaxID=1227364 RepID=A0A9W4TWM5_9ASCO|nr:unnamed protein product [Candida verbasci]